MRTLPLVILLLGVSGLVAQIEPPDFLCTSFSAGNEVLTWSNTSSACGPYEATEIYLSRGTAAGPYALLAELTDPGQTEYIDPNPAGELRYYFLRYRYACPGATVVNSDTLDNLIPATPPLSYVSLEDGQLLLSWSARNASPEVDRYRVFLVTATTTTLLDSVVAPGTSYRFAVPAGVDPTGLTIRISAVDACGNDGALSRAVRPMGLSLSGGTGCAAAIQLFPDQEAIATYLPLTGLEVFVAVNGAPFRSAGTFAPNADSVAYREANDGEQLCFYLEGELIEGLGRVRSAVACQTVAFSQPVRDLPLYGAGFTPAGALTLGYAEMGSPPALVEQSLRISRGNEVLALPLPEPVYNGTGTLTFPALPEDLAGGDRLSLRLTDACGREVTTNEVEPVYLQANALLPGQNGLAWTPLLNDLDGVITYSVARAIVADAGAAAGATYVPIASGLTERTLTDDTNGTDGIACYRVAATFQPADGTAAATFFSRPVCVEPTPAVYLPTAFNPAAVESVNQRFRPLFSRLPAATDYRLLVFDRWGGLVFETADPATGWDGTRNGQPLPSGTYLYQLRFTAPNGQLRQTAGTVNLLR